MIRFVLFLAIAVVVLSLAYIKKLLVKKNAVADFLRRMRRARIGANATGDLRMFQINDLFQWDRFITPTIIKTFYWLVIALVILSGISGIFGGQLQMAVSPCAGFIMVLMAIAGVVAGVE